MLSKIRKKRRSPTFTAHLDKMLYLVSRRYEPIVSVHRFLWTTLIVCVTSFFSLFVLTSEIPLTLATSNPFGSVQTRGNIRLGIGFSAFASCLAGVLPYLILRLRYVARKVKASYDLLDALKVIARHAHLAVDTALSRTADDLSSANVLKRPLKLLSFSFASYMYEEELKREAERFVRVIDSTFAVSFASDLIHAYKTGGGIKDSLEILITSMENQLIRVLDGKSELSDAIHVGTWINLLSIIALCGGISASIGWTAYAKLQFQTVQGVVFMTLILVTTLIGFVIGLFLSKPRLDYK